MLLFGVRLHLIYPGVWVMFSKLAFSRSDFDAQVQYLFAQGIAVQA
jgi:hypothetical protein